MDKKYVQALHKAFDDAKTLFESVGLPPVKHIDKFRGQPLQPEDFEYFALPAVFYELRCDWSKTGRLYTGQMTVTYHIVQDETWEISNIATNRDEGLKQIDLLNAIRAVLDNLVSDNTGTMQRVMDLSVDSGVTIYDTLTYNCQYNAPTIQIGKFEVEVTPAGMTLSDELSANFE